MKPRILITNDDGHRAPGILALAEALEAVGEVFVVGPQRQRSAVSHSITLHKPLRIWEERARRFVCSGSPVDCVYLGVHEICSDRSPDLVVSGINRGANLGNDVFYSGTVAGAMEGLLMGVPSMAVSQLTGPGHRLEPGDYDQAARISVQVARRMLSHPLPVTALLNLNVPYRYDPERGVKVTTLGRRIYDQGIVKGRDPRGNPYYWIGGSDAHHDPIEGSDCILSDAGYATITPVRADLTAPELMPHVESWELSESGDDQ